MKEKWDRGEFGYCPRVLCNMQRVLPYGEGVDLLQSELRVFCPLCQGLFKPDYYQHAKLDGYLFGPSFAPKFLVTYPISNNEAKTY